MDLIGIGSIIEGVGKVADSLVTTDKERLQMALEDRKLDWKRRGVTKPLTWHKLRSTRLRPVHLAYLSAVGVLLWAGLGFWVWLTNFLATP